MHLTVSELRKIVENFMTEQFEVEKFRSEVNPGE